ncbi:hypothetical protein M5K25_013445 [Dendrobium thyrsiflorum]|uniref:Ycf2 n=1 Tax=Dendrobium thyrsiflorum TaxID=117978 RepID=A0ABD0UZR8_DENTH
MRKSFKDEDMTSRRIFLRSYPLRWEEQEEELADEFSPRNEVLQSTEKMRHCSKLKSLIKNNLIEMFNWGQEKLILLKKIKNKVSFYLLSCHPFGFKSPTKLISTA